MRPKNVGLIKSIKNKENIQNEVEIKSKKTDTNLISNTFQNNVVAPNNESTNNNKNQPVNAKKRSAIAAEISIIMY